MDQEQNRFNAIANAEYSQLRICYEDGGREAVKNLIQAKIGAVVLFLTDDAGLGMPAALGILQDVVDQFRKDLVERQKHRPNS